MQQKYRLNLSFFPPFFPRWAEALQLPLRNNNMQPGKNKVHSKCVCVDVR